ncbi:ABC-type branched-chain amino acid transport system, substrate-binding protein [Devosia crocina]|uniref:ABC-type branched-chain amino acid transport system, substrate-binding protein n=1 Tax=Devosia crocina TaxID=429728 RepID=A0A1I7NSX5_9HYPH|nr:penicillin-binding protein activator [Devosia crocina]SFV37763.1 ABC-type branched-chain amino acid transport system, substrate-binding protein [Devosia crocina]
MAKRQNNAIGQCGVLALALGLVVASCAPGTLQLGSRSLGWPTGNDAAPPPSQTMPMPTAKGEVFGRGPVPVSLLLPLSGDRSLADIGRSLANASKLAIAFVEANPNIAENITITLRDTGDSVAGATNAANAALAGGARLIIGPLRGDQVAAAGAVARSAGVPLIGFSTNGQAAGGGVYLLSVLPEMEMKRAISYLKAEGRRGLAGAFPATPYGEALATAFRQQAIAAGFAPGPVYTFSDASEAAQIVAQAKSQIDRGMIDAFFIPERTSAPAFAQALASAGVTNDMVQIVGSADWAGDATILGAPGLNGALYPAIDEAGSNAIAADYAARFNARPHPLATIAYTATILANVNTLSLATPPYNPSLLTSPAGFNGRDGQFRFLSNGRAEYALVMKRIGGGAATTVDGPKL